MEWKFIRRHHCANCMSCNEKTFSRTVNKLKAKKLIMTEFRNTGRGRLTYYCLAANIFEILEKNAFYEGSNDDE